MDNISETSENFLDKHQEKIKLLSDMLTENKDNPDRMKVALGLVKKELEKQPFNDELHELYLTHISYSREYILRFINDLISAFSITLDYKYYDLILMVISKSLRTLSENNIEGSAPFIEELHKLITISHEKKQQELKSKVRELDYENKDISRKLRKEIDRNNDLIKEIDTFEIQNDELKTNIDKLKSNKKLLEEQLNTKSMEVEELNKEKNEIEKLYEMMNEDMKEITYSNEVLEKDIEAKEKEYDKILKKNQKLIERIDSISDVVANVVIQQDAQFDKIESKLKNFDKIEDRITEDVEYLKINEDETAKQKSQNNISDRVSQYIQSLEKLLKGATERSENLKQQNEILQQEIEMLSQTEPMEGMESETEEQIYQKAYDDAYKKIYDEIFMTQIDDSEISTEDIDSESDKEKVMKLLQENEMLKETIIAKDQLIESYQFASERIEEETYKNAYEELKQKIENDENAGGIINEKLAKLSEENETLKETIRENQELIETYRDSYEKAYEEIYEKAYEKAYEEIEREIELNKTDNDAYEDLSPFEIEEIKNENQKLKEELNEKEILAESYKKSYEEAYTHAYKDAYDKVYQEAKEELEAQKEELNTEEEELSNLKENYENIKEELETKEELLKSYKEAVYDMFDENHELIQSQEESEKLLDIYITGVVNLISGKKHTKKSTNKKKTQKSPKEKKNNNNSNEEKEKKK